MELAAADQGGLSREQDHGTKIPPEIWDQILDYLWNDTAALRACSLSYRLWLPSTRYHLFRTFRLHVASNSDTNPPDFGSMLSPSLPTLVNVALYVHQLIIANSVSSAEIHPSWTGPDLRRFLRRLKTVEILCVEGGSLFGSLKLALRTYLPQVKAVYCRRLVLSQAQDLISVLNAYERLTTLHISGGLTRPRSSIPTREELLRTEVMRSGVLIQDMTLQWSSYSELLVRWLCSGPSQLQMRKLSLGWLMGHDTTLVRDLLREVGASLEHLQIFGTYADDVSHQLDLQHNTRLSLLHIGQIHLTFATFTQQTFQWVPALLSSVRSPELRTIRFTLHLSDVSNLDHLNWPQIDEHLVILAKRIPGLVVKIVAFFVYSTLFETCHEPPRVEEIVMERLPNVRDQQIRIEGFTVLCQR